MAIWCVKTCGSWDISKGRFEITTSFSSGKKKKKSVHYSEIQNIMFWCCQPFPTVFFNTQGTVQVQRNLQNETLTFQFKEPQMEHLSLFIYTLTEEGQRRCTTLQDMFILFSPCFMFEKKIRCVRFAKHTDSSLRRKPFMGLLFPYDFIALIDPGFVGFQFVYARHIKPSDPTDFSYRK